MTKRLCRNGFAPILPSGTKRMENRFILTANPEEVKTVGISCLF